MRRERLDAAFDLAFFLVELVAALEITGVIVANAKITDALVLSESHSSWVLDAYLYPLVLGMVACLVSADRIARTTKPRAIFATGLALFAGGNVLCALSHGAIAFFAGRVVMGFGAALAFTGELWSVSLFHGHRLARPLVLGEVGGALGVVAGPLVGAFVATTSAEGWRHLFLLDGGIAVFALALVLVSVPKDVDRAATIPPEREAPRESHALVQRMMVLQTLVSLLTVGAEYLFSDYLQSKLGMSARFVGGMTMLASFGIVAGSVLAGRMADRFETLPMRAVPGVASAVVLLAALLRVRAIDAAAIPIVLVGVCMGLANVSIYAVIVERSAPDTFLRRSLVYLIAMEIGNALGIQAVGVAEYARWGVVATTCGVLGTAALVWTGYRVVDSQRRVAS